MAAGDCLPKIAAKFTRVVAPTSRQDNRAAGVIERRPVMPWANRQAGRWIDASRQAQKRATCVALLRCTADYRQAFRLGATRPALLNQAYSASLKVMKLARPWRSTRIETERFLGSDCATSVKFFAEVMAWLFR